MLKRCDRLEINRAQSLKENSNSHFHKKQQKTQAFQRVLIPLTQEGEEKSVSQDGVGGSEAPWASVCRGPAAESTWQGAGRGVRAQAALPGVWA